MTDRQFLYTAYFCEENIWQLLSRLLQEGRSEIELDVVFISNSARHVALYQQRAAPVGAGMVWDYHVILIDRAGAWVYDLDSRLHCPASLPDYLQATLPDPRHIPADYLPRFRVIPASDYLRCLDSDRSHMYGQVPETEFPHWPPIHATDQAHAVRLDQYWDTNLELPGSWTGSQSEFLQRYSGHGPLPVS